MHIINHRYKPYTRYKIFVKRPGGYFHCHYFSGKLFKSKGEAIKYVLERLVSCDRITRRSKYFMEKGNLIKIFIFPDLHTVYYEYEFREERFPCTS